MATNAGQVKGHAPTSAWTPADVAPTDDAPRVTLRPGALNGFDGQPADPKSWALSVEIDPELGLQVRRLARVHRETVSLTVSRLLRVGLRRYRRTHGGAIFEDLPRLRPLPPLKRQPASTLGRIRLIPAPPEVAEALITAAELVGKATTNGEGEGEDR